MKKRSWLMCIALVLSLTIALGGTLAYLTDTDADVNTMTLGNVKIEQIEKERIEQSDDKTTKDNVKDFKQDKPLYPYVGELDWAEEYQQWPTGGSSQLFKDELKNVVDKFVFVENTGKSNAYVRTWFAFEKGSLTYEKFDKLVGINRNGTNWQWDIISKDETIGDSTYVVMCATYLGNAGDNKDEHKGGVLPSGKTTRPSLLQVYLDKTATNEDVEAIDGNGNGKYDILVLSQAIQADGFSDAATALKEGFTNEVPDFTVSEPEVNYPEAQPETGSNGVMTLELDPDNPVQITDLKNPIEISGEGTVVLKGADVTAEEGKSGLTIAPGAKVTLMVSKPSKLTGGTGADGITVGEGAEVVITGTSTLTAIGNGGVEDWDNPNGDSGHGIGGSGDIVIRDLNGLDAQGYGKGGTGIGGESSSITIENTNVINVQGGFSTIKWKPTDYGKEDPEGAPGIGSTEDGTVITLVDTTIKAVTGGSKAAGIGAQFWDSVTINITNCNIEKAIGGGYGAGIGASRGRDYVEGEERQYCNITIVDSTINAEGGLYGSGVGSAYDSSPQNPVKSIMTTIYIKGNSVITAQGGERAAGIGTGYHCGALAGEIESTVAVNAKAGGDPYKAGTYTPAQDVGFGILDPTRSGKDNTYYFMYKGEKITMPAPITLPTETE